MVYFSKFYTDEKACCLNKQRYILREIYLHCHRTQKRKYLQSFNQEKSYIFARPYVKKFLTKQSNINNQSRLTPNARLYTELKNHAHVTYPKSHPAISSMFPSLCHSCEGLSLRFCKAAAAVPGLCPSNGGSGSLREGLVPSFVGGTSL